MLENYKCIECKKDIGNYFTGKWRSVNGEKYCLDCAKKVEDREVEKSSAEESKKEREEKKSKEDLDVCTNCSKVVGSSMHGAWGIYKGEKYCKPCLRQKQEAKSNKISVEENKSEKLYLGKTCLECQKKISNTTLNDFEFEADEKAYFDEKFTLGKDDSYPHFCSIKCKGIWIKREMGVSILEENIQQKQKGSIEEIKCTCRQCGHVWHYLKRDETGLKTQALGNLLIGCGMCCNPFGALFTNKSIDASREGQKLSKCPKCGTGNIKKESHYYDQE